MKMNSIYFVSISLLSGLLFSMTAKADCPTIQQILTAFNKTSTPPKGWHLYGYTSKEVNKNFYFDHASWSLIGSKYMQMGGNVECIYLNSDKKDTGYLILEDVNFTPAPTGKGWKILASSDQTMTCKGAGDTSNCPF